MSNENPRSTNAARDGIASHRKSIADAEEAIKARSAKGEADYDAQAQKRDALKAQALALPADRKARMKAELGVIANAATQQAATLNAHDPKKPLSPAEAADLKKAAHDSVSSLK